ncbi:mannose-6-phosphate isomerase, class I [Kroppenstedtia sanguinis]|uniref:mannose-6-phosphate isomerase n=1 Tax=Kroppenstedtia sanguinis TaxID=1380684 RepID=A0ABW4CAJ1_9BACL
MTKMEPIFFHPVFKERIWGGRKLQGYGYELPEGNVGESWLISAHPHGVSQVNRGVFQGKTLQQLWQEHPGLFGHPPEEKFPLLIKLLDATHDLSVQVHPDDSYANKYEQEAYGKTECWYVVDCEEDAELILGHTAATREELASMIDAGQWTDLLQRIPIQPGDFYLIPSGTVHAICQGTVVLEVQQSSDATYRLYDYDRTDSQGKKRELHLKKGLDVIQVPHIRSTEERKVFAEGENRVETLTENSRFSLHRIQVQGDLAIPPHRTYALGNLLRGSLHLITDGGVYPLKPGDSFLLPHDLGSYRLSGSGELFITEPATPPEGQTRKKAKAAVDLGGTNLRVAAILSDGSIGRMLTSPTFAHLGPDYIIQNMIQLLQSLQSEWDFESIGIASPGPLDARQGVILHPPNLPGWEAIPLKDRLQSILNLPVQLENDANAAALGEALFGAGQGKQSVFYMTVSTGIGGGFVYEGKIIQGAHSCAAEIGNMVIDPHGPEHPLLNRGALEVMASGTALNREIQRELSHLDSTAALFRSAAEGNPSAKRVVDEFLQSLSIGIANIIHVVDPDLLIIGGGVLQSKEWFWEDLLQKVQAYLYPQLRGQVEIKPAALEGNSGLIGAAHLDSQG